MKSLFGFFAAITFVSSVHAGTNIATIKFVDEQGGVFTKAQVSTMVPVVIELPGVNAEQIHGVILQPEGLETSALETVNDNGEFQRVCTENAVQTPLSRLTIAPNSKSQSDFRFEKVSVVNTDSGAKLSLNILVYSNQACSLQAFSLTKVLVLTKTDSIDFKVIEPAVLAVTE